MYLYLYLYWDWELVEYASFLADFARYTSPLLRNSAVSNSPSLSWLYFVFVFVFCQLFGDILSGFPLTNANSFPSSLFNLLHSICLPTTGTAGRALTCIDVRLVAVLFVFVFVFFSLLLQVGKCRGVRLISPGSAVGPKARQDGGAHTAYPWLLCQNVHYFNFCSASVRSLQTGRQESERWVPFCPCLTFEPRYGPLFWPTDVLK